MTYKILLFVFCVCAAMQGEAQGGGGGIGIYFQAAGISGQDNSNMFSGDGIFKYEQAESTTPEIKRNK
jgi:predicted extracellular nuclease